MEELYKACAPDDDLRLWLQKLGKMGPGQVTLLLTLFATFFKSTFALSQTQKNSGLLTLELVCSIKGFNSLGKNRPTYSYITIYFVIHS